MAATEKHIEQSAEALREIREGFYGLIRNAAPETEWQKFFSTHPYALSSSLPVKLHPADIVPLGRPGRSEPDFLIYPGTEHSLDIFGLVELKAPSSRLVRRARKNVLVLTADTNTAVGQLRRYDRDFETFMPEKGTAAFRLRSKLFVVIGMSSDLRALAGEISGNQRDIFPSDIECLGYDELLRNFEKGLPPPLMLEIGHKHGAADAHLESANSLWNPDDVSRVIMLLYGRMDHGGPFWSYVAIKPSMLAAFKRAQERGSLDLYDFDAFGEVVVSAEGTVPPKKVTLKIAELYGADVERFFSPVDPLWEINQKIGAARDGSGDLQIENRRKAKPRVPDPPPRPDD